ncbi:hypothetical protein BHE90_004128 [Fusarium euwallaceae]|uniref:HNH nuclease domain-containing protein n=1 Tax=Fusarium euwallaceae TaxID=1147111 RepID=A0A430M027_9HYPO|nr:hypothetical protein BHE90_004128 [Fusarium euwallaceae]
MDHQILKAVSAYLGEYTDQASRQALLDFTNARPNLEPVAPLIPTEEYTARLELIEEIRRDQRRGRREFEITRLQFCFLIRRSIPELQVLVRLGRECSIFVVEMQLNSFCAVIDYYLGRPEVSQDASDQNDTQRKACLTLDDDACLVTGKPHPNVCQILPFSLCKKVTEDDYFGSVELVIEHCLGCPLSDDIRAALRCLTDKPRSYDRAWNMICLSPTLQDWWGRGYFAFKFLEATPNEDGTSTAKLQFVWMPRIEHGQGRALEPINLDAQRDDRTRISATLTHHYGERSQSCLMGPDCPTCACTEKVNAHNVFTHRPAKTGSVFKVTRLTGDIAKFQRMIEIQWNIICAAALSGRAQDIEAEEAQRASQDAAKTLELIEKMVL